MKTLGVPLRFLTRVRKWVQPPFPWSEGNKSFVVTQDTEEIGNSITVGMDALSAHLDRAWELLSQGDSRGARAAARRCLEIEDGSPEAHNILGQAAAMDGEIDAAMEHYRTAMSLDDGYPDPMLNIAELMLHPLHDFDGAIDLCNEVLEFVDTRDEIIDALLLKIDAQLAKGDEPGAARTLDAVPEGPYEVPGQNFLVGRACFEVGRVEQAETLLREALRTDPESSDVHYYLGMTADKKGDWRTATEAFLKARSLELNHPRPPWSLPEEQFYKTAMRALLAVEPGIAHSLDGAILIASDQPGIEVVADGVDPRCPILLEGFGEPPPGVKERVPRLFVYQRNIERMCASIEDLEEEISRQIGDEVRHALGPAITARPAPESRRHTNTSTDDDTSRKKPRKGRT
jgi:Flp pilus assembly protein TadD